MTLALYIHWPFCKAKCPYCDFNSHVREKVDQRRWREALLKELRWYVSALHSEISPNKGESDSAGVGQGRLAPLNRSGSGGDNKQLPRISSIFFGGGTPSLMPPETVAALIAEAERLFGFTKDVEITLEANPTSVEAGKFRAYAAGGVNRLSLGIQSLTPRHLAFLGREHSAQEAKEALRFAADSFPRYSFDLIYALHDQSLLEWEAELKQALELAGEHLSLYQLTIEPGTRFYHLYEAGKLPVMEADDAAAYYELTQEIMEAAGMPAYEISNHARPGKESRHNLTYWHGGEYIGIGPGAHGRVRLKTTGKMQGIKGQGGIAEGKTAIVKHAVTNLRSPEKWLESVEQQGHGQESAISLTSQEIREERILMGIRLREGLPLSEFAPYWPEAVVAPLEQEGLIYLTPTHLVPTARGRLVLNALVERLVQ